MSRNQNAEMPSKLGRLFEICSGQAIGWDQDDLAEIFRHQLNTPLLGDLPLSAIEIQFLDSAACAVDQPALVTFGDLLRHPSPPSGLLKLVKESAKQADGQSDDLLPPPVASALYALSIAAALVRLGERISTMVDADLRQGFQWVIAQPWIEWPMRQLATDASSRLNIG